jgi:cyclopropane-fatty-acyl-phospholipid synthase
MLARIARGGLPAIPFVVRFWDGSELSASTGAPGPVVLVRSSRAIQHLLRQPNELGLARAWVTGALDLDGELEEVLAHRDRFARVSVSGRDRLRAARTAARTVGPAVLRRPTAVPTEARLKGRLHSVARDRAAVRHHYELPATFYRLLLGPTMVYSCAYFERPDESLERAQRRKLELICRKLQLRPGDRLLDVGCGWGSLVMHAAAHHGVPPSA